MIKLNHVVSEDNLNNIGDFAWKIEDDKRTLQLVIPTPQGQCFSEWTIDHPNENGAQWMWDGNEEKPSLHPSIDAVNIFHGWVKNGCLYGFGEQMVLPIDLPPQPPAAQG